MRPAFLLSLFALVVVGCGPTVDGSDRSGAGRAYVDENGGGGAASSSSVGGANQGGANEGGANEGGANEGGSSGTGGGALTRTKACVWELGDTECAYSMPLTPELEASAEKYCRGTDGSLVDLCPTDKLLGCCSTPTVGGGVYVACDYADPSMTLARAEALCRGVGPDSTYSRALP